MKSHDALRSTADCWLLVKMISPEAQLELLRRGAAAIVAEEELLEKLRSGRPLRIKHGADASTPRLHLGHAVPLRKLRQFQELGHEIIFIVGDFTGRIGDPSGKSETRRMLTAEEAEANAQRFATQAGKILDLDRTRTVFNSQWFSQLGLEDVIALASTATVAQILERDDFAQRYARQQPISLLELFYPLFQGYDSVAIKADVEVGGTDQTFNFAAARELMRAYGLPPQCFLTVPLLEGTDGVEKMGKSLGNTIDLLDTPFDKFGKIMSIPDPLMVRYYRLLTDLPEPEIVEMERGLADGTVHPMEAKRRLAREIVTFFDSKDDTIAAEREFDIRFKAGGDEDKLAEVARDVEISESEGEPVPVEIASSEGERFSAWFDPRDESLDVTAITMPIVKLLVRCGLVSSNSEARRMVEQGAVRVDGKRMDSIDREAVVRNNTVVQVGKRKVAKVVLKP